VSEKTVQGCGQIGWEHIKGIVHLAATMCNAAVRCTARRACATVEGAAVPAAMRLAQNLRGMEGLGVRGTDGGGAAQASTHRRALCRLSAVFEGAALRVCVWGGGNGGTQASAHGEEVSRGTSRGTRPARRTLPPP
jgi:hypothetical protein